MQTNFFSLELSDITKGNYAKIPYKLEPTDTMLGEMDDELIKLYTLYTMKVKQTKKFIFDIENGDTLEEDIPEETLNKLLRLKAEAEILGSIFWYELRCKFNFWNNTDRIIGVRANWIVVTSRVKRPKIFGINLGDLGDMLG